MVEPSKQRVPVEASRRARCTFGRLPSCGVTVYCHAHVLQHVLDYSDGDLVHERGGFLVGNWLDDEGPGVEIIGFLPAADTRAEAAQLTFTHETWARVTRAVERRFPAARIVGWHHTHPDMGVFLSRYDRFIHRHFFSAAWQIALVVDPVRQELGFFHWRDGEILDCGFVCVPAQQ